MATIVTGRDMSVTFGPGLPTVIIGERINPTGRKKLAERLSKGDLDVVEEEARNQKSMGANIIDVNVGAGEVDEKTVLPLAVRRACETSGLPVCIDSANAEALAAALEAYPYKALVNSVTGEEKSLDAVLPLVKRFGAAVIGLTINEDGIPGTAAQRLEVARRIVERAESYGISRDDVVIDCLTLTASADSTATHVTLEALRAITGELSVATAMGVSNISFGMPERKLINNTFLSMCIEAGLSAAIVDPTVDGLVYTVLSANFLMGKDEYARTLLSYYRQRSKQG